MLRFSKNSEQNHQIPVNRSESWIIDVFGETTRRVFTTTTTSTQPIADVTLFGSLSLSALFGSLSLSLRRHRNPSVALGELFTTRRHGRR
jgi:hypothetical protein